MPEWGNGATDDPRLVHIYDDAKAQLERTEVRLMGAGVSQQVRTVYCHGSHSQHVVSYFCASWVQEKFDIVIMDIADPIEDGPG